MLALALVPLRLLSLLMRRRWRCWSRRCYYRCAAQRRRWSGVGYRGASLVQLVDRLLREHSMKR